jgi:UDP-N-acetylmuramoylalanine--D-glutamate ligase
MKIAILGYGEQGRAAYDYWHDDNEITICDKAKTAKLPDDVQAQLGDAYLHGLDQFDLIARGPSVHPRDLVAANSPAILDKVTTVTNEFFKVCPSRNIIGVTGTKGKGTTSTLIAKMLEADSRTVHLGGNIGTPPLDLLKAGIKPDDWVVLELANFQLIDLQYSPHIAVCLMVVPEHLDWHSDAEEYYNSKTQLFRHQTSNDIAIYNDLNEASKRIASTGKGWKVPYMAFPGSAVVDGKIVIDNQVVCETAELQLLGRHNWENVCAAVTTVWKITQNLDAMRGVLTTFSGLPHRLELVRELDGVKYYDDSFGTTPETAIVALQAFEQPEIVILGGRGKGVPFDKLAGVVGGQPNVKQVIAIGESGAEITDCLKQAGYHNVTAGAATIEEIVRQAQKLAAPGDVVVLSTACASFDMFRNYQERGEQFSRAVQALA